MAENETDKGERLVRKLGKALMEGDTQERLDLATEVLGALKKAASAGSNEFCEAGKFADSAALRRVEGHLALAMAEGRMIGQGGGIQPFAGSK